MASGKSLESAVLTVPSLIANSPRETRQENQNQNQRRNDSMRMNRKWLVLIGCVGGIFAGTGSAFSQGGPYLHLGGGVAIADNVDLKTFFDPTPGSTIKFDPGFRFSAAGGYNFCPFVGVEMETGFIYNEFDTVNGLGNLDAAFYHVPIMGNLVLRYDQPNCPVIPYIGGGAGGDFSAFYLNRVSTESVFADGGSDTSLNFAWQAFGGVRFKLSDKMSIGGAYKYYSVEGSSWDFAGIKNAIQAGRANSHSFLVDFSMSF
jgi:opacity protein-like surface antigen